MADQVKWEYFIEYNFQCTNPMWEMKEWLNIMGEEGWEVIQLNTRWNGAIFKRKKGDCGD